MSRRITDRPYPYRSPYDEPFPPTITELNILRRQMHDAKVHLAAWARALVAARDDRMRW